ncbi:uncharacterized protein A4U43_C08F32990 [Asparagus officinalis]|nr:uncharacterized protein A4U43_C08F32990 [Asparagus officinalis]
MIPRNPDPAPPSSSASNGVRDPMPDEPPVHELLQRPRRALLGGDHRPCLQVTGIAPPLRSGPPAGFPSSMSRLRQLHLRLRHRPATSAAGLTWPLPTLTASPSHPSPRPSSGPSPPRALPPLSSLPTPSPSTPPRRPCLLPHPHRRQPAPPSSPRRPPAAPRPAAAPPKTPRPSGGTLPGLAREGGSEAPRAPPARSGSAACRALVAAKEERRAAARVRRAIVRDASRYIEERPSPVGGEEERQSPWRGGGGGRCRPGVLGEGLID